MGSSRVCIHTWALLAGLLAASSCGGGSGQGPSAVDTPPTALGPVSLTVVSGETQAPVAGARMVVGGTEYVADAQGRVTLPGGLAPAAPVDVLGAGFLDRQTMLSPRGIAGAVTLWPRESATGMNERFTQEVVYTTAAIGADPVPGGVALHRWADGVSQVAVTYAGPAEDSALLPFDERALGVQRAAVDEINQVLGGRISYSAPAPGAAAAGASVLLRINPSFGPCTASSDIWAVSSVTEGPIQSATINYCRPDAPRDLGLSVHELGHTLGLRHSSNTADVMAPIARRISRLSDRERLAVSLMLQRPNGNRFPDNDRGAQGAALAHAEIACRP